MSPATEPSSTLSAVSDSYRSPNLNGKLNPDPWCWVTTGNRTLSATISQVISLSHPV